VALAGVIGDGRQDERMIAKLISGGQTGVDRAALDVALELGIEVGGWCPRGRRAEDGVIPERYPLLEAPSSRPAQRTRWNVSQSDATLILTWGTPVGGTRLTLHTCVRQGKPHLVVDLSDAAGRQRAVEDVRTWLASAVAGHTLNVAGPRASQAPQAYESAAAFLRAMFGPGRRAADG
jgi:hypothetical protein